MKFGEPVDHEEALALVARKIGKLVKQPDGTAYIGFTERELRHPDVAALISGRLTVEVRKENEGPHWFRVRTWFPLADVRLVLMPEFRQ